MPRTTKSTRQALERLCEAAGFGLERDGRQYVVIYHPKQETEPTHSYPGNPAYPAEPPSGEEWWDVPPVAKTSARALALATSCVRHRPDWEEIREATAFDPGWTQVKLGGKLYTVPDIPDMIAWEEEELAKLAIHPDEED